MIEIESDINKKDRMNIDVAKNGNETNSGHLLLYIHL